MTLGGASAAFGAQGGSGDARCFQAASNEDDGDVVDNPNYNTNTGSHGNDFVSVPGHAWDNDQNAWNRCLP